MDFACAAGPNTVVRCVIGAAADGSACSHHLPETTTGMEDDYITDP